MKVLLVATVQSHIAQFHTGNIEILKKAGYIVHIAARNNLAEKNGLSIENADRIFDIDLKRAPLSKNNVKAYRQLKEIIQRGEYDIVHCNTPVGGMLSRLAVARLRKTRTTVIYTAHGFHFYSGAPLKNWIMFYPIEKWMAKYTDKLVTINQEDFCRAKEKFLCDVFRIHGTGIKSKKYNSVTQTEVEAYRKKYNCENKFVILCTGELNKNKNQVTIIQAMSKVLQSVPNAILLLTGNGPERENLQKLIEKLGLDDSVTLLGYRTDLQIFAHMCDIAVSASIREGLGLNLIEAMYCGKAVIASKNRGHCELIQDGKNGYLVEAYDVKGFAEKIVLLAKDSLRREKFGSAGLNISVKYTDEAVDQEMARIYEIV